MLKTQKELKPAFAAEVAKAWEDEKMRKWCINKTAYIIAYNDAIYTIDKPSIETRFCFSYGFCGVSSEEEEQQADNMARHAAESVEYFKSENLKKVNSWLDDLHSIKEEMQHPWAEGNHPRYMIATAKKYGGRYAGYCWNDFAIVDTSDAPLANGYTLCDDIAFIDELIAGYEEVKKQFEKRLNAYLKRYGLSKIDTWSFLSD